MPANIVRANYADLTGIARTFQANAQRTRASLQKLREQQALLESGDWLGGGAQAFYAEMSSDIVPTLDRLIRALEAAEQTTGQIELLMQQTEAECARLLRGNGQGQGGGLGAFAGMAGSLDNIANAGPALGAAFAAANGNGGATAKPGATDAVPFTVPAGAKAFLPQSTRALPDPTNLKWYGNLQNPDGSPRVVPGSQANAQWTRQFAQQWPGINAQRAKLDDAKGVLAETLREQAAAVARARQSMQKTLALLGTDGYNLVKQYQSLGRAAAVADSQAESAGLKLGAAQNRVAAIQAQQDHFDASASKKSWEGQRDEIQAAIKERQEAIGKVVDMGKSIATGGAKGQAFDQGAELIKTVVGGMTEAEMKQLIAAESNIAQYDAVMNKAAARVLTEQTAAAQKDLAAARVDFNAAQQTAHNLERDQRDALDQLANMERSKKAGTIFQELQRYNDQARTVGEEVRSQNADYLATLNRQPLAGAEQRYQQITNDIQHVQTYDGGTEAWFDSAKNAQVYQAEMSRWHQSEVAAATQLEQQLAHREHLSLIDDTMAALDRSQGGNPYNEGVVRPEPARR